MSAVRSSRQAAPPEQRRAAALCLRRKRGRWQLLLVTTRSGRPTLPKGRIEAGEAPAEAALREASEEAGVRGNVAGHVGSWRHGDGRQHVEGYVVTVRKTGRPHRDERWRTVRWVDVEEATEQLARRCVRRADREALRSALETATSLVAS
jgi:8-oxo-dGTP pyrophosphatase MutT (NUDIX family)